MMPKAKIGVSLEKEILAEFDTIVEPSKHFNISRSQAIESILAAFLKSPFDHAEKVKDLVLRRRRDLL